MNKYLFLTLLVSFSFLSCKEAVPGDTLSPSMIYTMPSDGATNVLTTSEVSVTYDGEVFLNSTNQIKVNNELKTASVSGSKLIINATLVGGKVYDISISARSVKDLAGNFAPAVDFSFTTKEKIVPLTDGKYEAENATFSSNLTVQTGISGYSGSGFVGGFKDAADVLSYSIDGITAGNYDIYVGYSTSNWGKKICNVDVNGLKGTFELTESITFSEKKFTTVHLLNGNNAIKITPNWTWFAIDYIRLVINNDPETPFNIDANLVTPGPSTQAVKLYDFLKTNFRTKIISGTMAAHSTNINEATWVNEKTGKWPALTCFDFIDHTILGSGTIAYEAPFTLGSGWWNNNGIVGLMWHWRDPLTKTGAFYTDNTTFDVSKISNTGSPEYAAMIADIDTIAGFLKEFKKAGIPVIWRPLHEAAGGWFWWGAKGPGPCKALWQLMYDRMVNYHGLNNLIWVWTTNTNSDALDWYPGHNYVDIIGMDIYPGENQHNSQIFEYNKAKAIFEGRKILTLSESGSIPDPAQMLEYGDRWSWFMPWNGDFTRSDTHNGAAFWNKILNYSYVIKRSDMPDLH